MEDRLLVTMSTLGRNGRFANQIFQYAFLKIFAQEHGFRVETSEWIGKKLFGHSDPLITKQLPVMRILLPQDRTTKIFPDALIMDNPEPLLKEPRESFMNVDLWGYFQFHTRYYAPYKEYFLSLFKPVPEVKTKLDYAYNSLRSMGKTIICVHLRRKDYGYGPFFIAPAEWYKEWLDDLWKTLEDPVLFIASDEPEKVISGFDEYSPITSKDLNIDMPGAEYYPDFYLLSRCDIVAISNSSYSFASCMLNGNSKLFMRPHLPSNKLIPFEPWDSEVLFYDEEIIESAQKHLKEGDTKYVLSVCGGVVKTHPYDVIRLASACIDKLQQEKQPYDNACYILGAAFQETGQTDKALHYYKKTLQLNPNHAEAGEGLKRDLKERRNLKGEVISYRQEIHAESSADKFGSVYKENCKLLKDRAYIICAMFTPDKPRRFQYADRLASSCEKFRLPYIIYEVAGIHKSITPHGQEDLAFTKANFILFNMLRFPGKSILYLDADVFFIRRPDVFDTVTRGGYDFAIYNWLNDRHNEAYMPLGGATGAENAHAGLYKFSHCVNIYDPDQLICSGAAQFYRNSGPAKFLLNSWQNVIAGNPDYADDECLDYTFNNFIPVAGDFKPFWLEKSYCRYPWWPHVKPVILHPELPGGERRVALTKINNLLRFNPEKCQIKSNKFLFPPDCVIDTKKQLLMKILNNQIVDKKPIRQKFYIYPEDIGLS